MQSIALQVEELMVFRETIAVDYDNHMKLTNTLFGQNAEFQYCHDLGCDHRLGMDW
jgi:hypothetical protein